MSRVGATVAKGMAAGLAGGAVMTATSKAEQALTGRPDSYVPGRTLAHLVRLPDPDRDRLTRNLAMPFGIAAAHKAVYAFATGAVADALISPGPGTSVQRPAQRLRLPGFA